MRIRWKKVACNESGTYHTIRLLTRTSRAKFVGYLTEQLNFMAYPLISHYSPDLTYYKTYFMYSYGSDNIHLPYPTTSSECSSKLECYHLISHHCAICSGRTPLQMLWYTSIHATLWGKRFAQL